MTKEEIIVSEIIEAAKKLFQQFGLNKTTMEDIAKSMGKGKSTLYYYFKSKDEIFDQVVLQEMNDVFVAVKNAVNQETDVQDKLRAYILVRVETLQNKINLYRLTMETYGVVNLTGHFAVLREKYDEQEVQLISSILQLGIDEGLIHAIQANDISMLAEIIVASIRGIEMDFVMKKKLDSLSERADILVTILIGGLT